VLKFCGPPYPSGFYSFFFFKLNGRKTCIEFANFEKLMKDICQSWVLRMCSKHFQLKLSCNLAAVIQTFKNQKKGDHKKERL
jgi:hypothetical protein